MAEVFDYLLEEGGEKIDLFSTESMVASSTGIKVEEPQVDYSQNQKIVDAAAAIVERGEDTSIMVGGRPYTSAMCSTFACKVLLESGLPLPKVGGEEVENIPTARAFYDALDSDPNYEFIENREDTKAGDIVFIPGSGLSRLHTGIQSKDYIEMGEDLGWGEDDSSGWQVFGGIQMYHDVGKESLPGKARYRAPELSSLGSRTFVGAFRYIGDLTFEEPKEEFEEYKQRKAEREDLIDYLMNLEELEID